MPPTRFLTPYAAKAIIEHEFDTDHLNIWITFRYSMDSTVKPANAKWICKVDSVTKTVTASAWQSEYTLLLTVASIASHPDRVTLAYDGPDGNLKTTWNKQWEPWGPILSSDSIGLPFGNFFGNEIAWSQVATQNTWYTISDSDITGTPLHRMTFQNNQELKIAEAGYYLLTYYATFESNIANKHVLIAPEINSTEQLSGRNHYEFSKANEEMTIAGSSLVLLAVDDVVSLGVASVDAGTPTISVDHIGLTLTQIGVS